MTPSSNWDTGVARAFHAATKYHAGPGRILMGDGEDAIWQQDLSIEPMQRCLEPVPGRDCFELIDSRHPVSRAHP